MEEHYFPGQAGESNKENWGHRSSTIPTRVKVLFCLCFCWLLCWAELFALLFLATTLSWLGVRCHSSPFCGDFAVLLGVDCFVKLCVNSFLSLALKKWPSQWYYLEPFILCLCFTTILQQWTVKSVAWHKCKGSLILLESINRIESLNINPTFRFCWILTLS